MSDLFSIDKSFCEQYQSSMDPVVKKKEKDDELKTATPPPNKTACSLEFPSDTF